MKPFITKLLSCNDLKIQDKKVTIKRYEDRLKEFGRSVKTMGWRDKRQQELRFSVLTQVGNLNSKSILDVGCGFGDLYAYLLKNGINVKYAGYDISPKIIELAKQSYPDITLEVKDILVESENRRFDYVFSSGIFNHRITSNLTFAKKMIKRMFELADKAIAVNMMTSYVDYRDKYLFYYPPEEIFRFAKSLSRFAVLRHDYPLYEFTLYIYKKANDYGIC